MAEKIEQRSVSVRIDGKEITNSLKAITAEAKSLRDQLSKVEEGTDSYVQKALGLSQVNEAARLNRAAVQSIAEAWAAMPEQVKKDVTEMQSKIAALTKTFKELEKTEKDANSPKLTEIKAEIDRLTKGVTDTTRQFQNLKKTVETPFVNGSWNKLDADIKAVTADLKNATKGSQDYINAQKKLNTLNKDLESHKKGIKDVEGAWLKNIPAIQGFAAAAVGALVIDRAIQFGTALVKSAVSVSMATEQVKVAFDTMLGSKEKSDKLQAELIQLAATTPFELKDVQEASKKLLAFGFTANEVVPNLTALGNIAAGVGQEKLPQLILAFGQVKAATRLTGNELRQFTEAGVPLMDELAKNLKKPVSEIKKMVEEGKIGFPLVEQAMKGLTTEGGRFANMMEKQSQTLGGLYSTFKDVFTQNVLLPIGDGISQIAKPAMSALIDSMEKLNPATHQASDGVARLQTQFNIEIETLKKSNLTQETRKTLIAKINKEYGQYLPALLTEKSSIQDITNAQNAANSAFSKKITMMAAEETLVAIQKDLFKAKRSELDLQESLTVSEQSLLEAKEATSEADMMGAAASKDVLSGRRKDVEDNLASQKKLQDEYAKALETAKKLGVDLNTVTGSVKPVGTIVDADKLKKEAEKAENALDRLREKVLALENDAKQAGLEGIEKELAKVKEKYAKELKELEDFKKKHGQKSKEANDLECRLQKLQTQEIANIVKQKFDDLAEKEAQFAEEAALRLQSREEKEVAAIEKKYRKEIELATVLENDVVNLTEPQREQAHTLRLKLETDREIEVANMKLRIRSEQAQKDSDETAKFLADMQKLNDETFALMNAQPVKISGKIENTDEASARIQAIQEAADREIAIETKKYDDHIKLLGDDTKTVADLTKKKGDIITALTKKAANDVEKIEKESIGKRQQAYAALGSAIGDGIVALGDLIAGEGAKNTAIQKTAALAKIAIDTATAISSVVTAAASTSLTPLDMGIKIAAGIATVLINIANARRTLMAAPEVKQKFDGGEVVGEQDGKTYRPKFYGEAQTGYYPDPSLFLTSEKGGEYVIAYPETRDPIVANFLPYLEATRQRRVRGFADGGSVGENVPTPTPSVQNNFGGQSMVNVPVAMFERFMSMTEGVISAFDRGIVLGFEDVEHIEKMSGNLKNRRGYN